MEKKISIFGGSFNPPTTAHCEIMRRLLEQDFDQVWVVPSGERSDKPHQAADYDRLRMLELLKEEEFNGDPRLVISDFELKLPRPSETFRTVQALHAAYSCVKFWFVFGSDSYRDMPNWEHGEELREKLNIVVVERASSPIPKADNVCPLSIDSDLAAVSSTYVRQKVEAGEPIEGLVSAGVGRYIAKNGLYHKDFVPPSVRC